MRVPTDGRAPGLPVLERMRRSSFIYAGVTLLLSGCFLDGTVYAPGYTESAFERIDIGDSRDTVYAALGEPLYTVGYRFYHYYKNGTLIFLVDTQKQEASLARFCKPPEEELAKFGNKMKLTELEASLGAPERIIGVDLGQSDDPTLFSLVYSQPGDGLYWKNRKLDLDKESGKVVKKVSNTIED